MVAAPDDDGSSVHPYAETALDWFDAGWSPLPLPANQKWPPPKGYTGYDELEPTRKKIKQWIAEMPEGNVAIRMPKNMIGIDVDAYGEKHGDVTLAQLEEQYGALPPTIRTSARGADNPSGIRWFRIREGEKFPGVLGEGIEVIQWHHRYAVAPPSINPKTGTAYEAWFEDAPEELLDTFAPDDATELPEDWYAVTAVKGKGLDKQAELAPAEIAAWFEDEANAGTYCRAMRNVYTRELAKLEEAADGGESRYDTARDGVMALVRLAQEGHRGVKRALAGLKRAYEDAVSDEPDRDPGEWRRMVWGAVEAVAGAMEDAHAAGKCPDRAPSGADVDPSLWPAPTAPADVAERFVAENYSHTAGESITPTLAYWRGDFYRWVGPHWEELPVDALKSELYRVLTRVAYMSAAAQPVELQWHPNTTKINHVLDALRAFCYTPARDGEPDVVSFVNGALRLHRDGTRELVEHTPTRFNLTSLPFEYVAEAPAPKQWLRFLDSLFPDDPESIHLLQQWFGYVVSGDTAQQKLCLLVGPPRAGKGLIARVLTELIGKHNVAGPTLAQLGTNFGLQPLIGKSLAIVGDARFHGGGQSAVVERLLSITGEDVQTIDRKNAVPWTGRVSARFMILSNELPSLNEASGALAARFVGPLVLRRSWLGSEDLTLEARLLAELPSVLLWALDGLDALRSEGRFAAPESSRTAMTELEELSSPETAFMRECCVKRRGAETPTAELYRVFQRWCDAQGRRNVPTFPIFCRNLKAAFPFLVFKRTTKGYARQTQVLADTAVRENMREVELV
jgi:P4 family phage/plasmid primase-like protien